MSRSATASQQTATATATELVVSRRPHGVRPNLRRAHTGDVLNFTLSNIAKVSTLVWTHPSNQGRRARQLGKAIAFQLGGRLANRKVITPIGRHSQMYAEVHVNGAASVVYANPPDYAEMTYWKSILREGGLFVDVGANVGAYALWACDAGCDAVAVEAAPDAVRRLRENIALNGYEARIEVVEAAVGPESGEMWFTTDLGNMNHLVEASREAAVSVPVTTLDDVIGDRRVAGMKLDIEGAERLALLGASQAMADGRLPIMQIEWNSMSERHFGEPRTSLAELLHQNGYQLYRPDGNGRHLLAVGNHPPHGADVFAVQGSV